MSTYKIDKYLIDKYFKSDDSQEDKEKISYYNKLYTSHYSVKPPKSNFIYELELSLEEEYNKIIKRRHYANK